MICNLSILANEVVLNLLQEDRIDNLIAKYPQLKLDRFKLEDWAEFDPTDRKKYLPWIVAQVAKKKLNMPNDGDHLKDQLREFERLVSIPGFTGSRDIQSYDWPEFDQTITQNLELRSRSERQRAARRAKKGKDVSQYEHKRGVSVVNEDGNLTLLKITEPEALSWWSWKAYSADNPNWDGKPLTPPPPGTETDISDRLWCVRNPSYGESYLRREPTKAFYLVLKNGGPYLGILFQDGQAKTLHNNSMPMGVAAEVYTLLEPVIQEHAKLGVGFLGELRVFEDLRLARGDVQPGERFSKDVDLRGSSVTELPPNLTFDRSLTITDTPIRVIPEGTKIGQNLYASDSSLEIIAQDVTIGHGLDASNSKLRELPPNLTLQNLDISYTPMRELPPGLTVKGKLGIEGTLITHFPDDMKLGDDTVTYSEPMSEEEIKRLFYNKTLPSVRRSFEQDEKIVGLSARQKETKWKQFKKELWAHFLQSADVQEYISKMFLKKEPRKAE